MEIRMQVSGFGELFEGQIEFSLILFPGFLDAQLHSWLEVNDELTISLFVTAENEVDLQERMDETIAKLRKAFSMLSESDQKLEPDNSIWVLSPDDSEDVSVINLE